MLSSMHIMQADTAPHLLVEVGAAAAVCFNLAAQAASAGHQPGSLPMLFRAA